MWLCSTARRKKFDCALMGNVGKREAKGAKLWQCRCEAAQSRAEMFSSLTVNPQVDALEHPTFISYRMMLHSHSNSQCGDITIVFWHNNSVRHLCSHITLCTTHAHASPELSGVWSHTELFWSLQSYHSAPQLSHYGMAVGLPWMHIYSLLFTHPHSPLSVPRTVQS